ncbi:MAG: hypothetical protein HXX13_16915 [Bacteroidetes bacterium]|nr:hypothetical protein [Bacteroidota bacterium]
MAIYREPVSTNKILSKENYGIFALFIITAVVVYLLPKTISQAYFILLLLIFYQSKKSYFWIAFFFILVSQPAGFFTGSTASDMQRIPMYSFGKGFSFSFYDLFFMTSIVKAIFTPQPKYSYFFKSSLKVLVIYGIVLLINSFSLGMSLPSMILIGRTTFFPFLFFLIIPRFIPDYSHFIKLFRLLLPFIILSFIGQVYEISYGKYIISIFKSGPSTIASTGAALAEGSEDVSRVFDASFLNTFSLIVSGILLIRGDRNFKPLFLIVIIFLNFLICFTSATRGPFLTFSVIMFTIVIYIFFSSGWRLQYFRYFMFAFILLIVGKIALNSADVLNTQIERSSERFGTIEILFSGDASLKGENARTERRIPRLLKKFNESPIIGWGFSDEGIEYQDGHVGFHNMLREGGILEIAVFLLFFFQMISRMNKISKRPGILLSERNGFRLAIVSIFALMITHATSAQYFGYFVGFESNEKWVMLSLLFVGFSAFYHQTNLEINNRLTARYNENNNPVRGNGNPLTRRNRV